MHDAPIRVMIVDDQPVIHTGLSTFLEVFDDLELVGAADDGVNAVAQCARLQPNVILMDVSMPRMNGIVATRFIRRLFPETQIIGLSSTAERDLINRMLDAGAVGHLQKNVSIDELADAIRAAHVGCPTRRPDATPCGSTSRDLNNGLD